MNLTDACQCHASGKTIKCKFGNHYFPETPVFDYDDHEPLNNGVRVNSVFIICISATLAFAAVVAMVGTSSKYHFQFLLFGLQNGAKLNIFDIKRYSDHKNCN